MLANVQQKTIKPIITGAVAPDILIHTDEYGIYARLESWGLWAQDRPPWARRIRPGRGW